MKHVLYGAAALALAALPGAALAEGALSAKYRVELAAQPAELWQKIGGWCAIADWHPAVTSCEEAQEDGAQIRLLTLADGGGVIREKLLEQGETSYRYAILDGPLPVANYTASLEVSADDDGGSGVMWRGSFDANGLSDDETTALLKSVYQAGLESVAAME